MSRKLTLAFLVLISCKMKLAQEEKYSLNLAPNHNKEIMEKFTQKLRSALSIRDKLGLRWESNKKIEFRIDHDLKSFNTKHYECIFKDSKTKKELLEIRIIEDFKDLDLFYALATCERWTKEIAPLLTLEVRKIPVGNPTLDFILEPNTDALERAQRGILWVFNRLEEKHPKLPRHYILTSNNTMPMINESNDVIIPWDIPEKTLLYFLTLRKFAQLELNFKTDYDPNDPKEYYSYFRKINSSFDSIFYLYKAIVARFPKDSKFRFLIHENKISPKTFIKDKTINIAFYYNESRENIYKSLTN